MALETAKERFRNWWNEFQYSDRIYIVPTVFGGLFVCGLIMGFSYGIYLNRPLLQLLCFLLSIFFMVSMLQSNQNLADIVWTRIKTQATEAGQKTFTEVSVQNESTEAKFSLAGKIRVPGRRAVTAPLPLLESKREGKLLFEIQAPSRGIYPLPGVSLNSKFPVGLFSVSRQKKFDGEWVVYPEAKGDLRLPSERFDDGDDFKGHRKHIPGESQKKIDWKAHARGSHGLVKEFESPSLTQEEFSFKQIDSQDTEVIVSQITLWVLKANEQGKSFSIDLPKRTLELGSGDAHFKRALALLAGYPS